MSSNHEHKIPILSFYSGGGFMDMGFEQAGFEIVWTNEFDKDFAKLHAAGITSWRKSLGNEIKAEIFNTKSITDVSSKEIIAEAFPEEIPEHFGMIGGPPCQDFSMNGSLKGFDGDRGKLTILFFDKILELKPTFFVMENVTGLIKRKDTKEFLQTLLERVEKEYFIDREKLNALEFGVPQFRERIFFIGIRKSILDKEIVSQSPNGKWFPFPINIIYKHAATKYNWAKQDEFGKKLTKPIELPLELCVESCLVSDNKINVTDNANEFFRLYVTEKSLQAIWEGETNRPSFKRLHRFRYSPTACYGNNEVHLHPYKHRRISVREALRIQGVPDEYVLPSELPMSKKFKMIGNGVPVPLAKALANALRVFIYEKGVIKYK
jgi:DNA (cytosine-5)-methyltransferase 1